MALQSRIDNSSCPLIRNGYSFWRNGIILQDAGRTEPLVYGTIMAQNATTKTWSPFIALNNTAGLSTPRGIYIGDEILAADLVAGDIADCPIMVGGCAEVDETLVVWDADTQSADSIISAAAANPYIVIDARACLMMFGIYLVNTEDISAHEN